MSRSKIQTYWLITGERNRKPALLSITVGKLPAPTAIPRLSAWGSGCTTSSRSGLRWPASHTITMFLSSTRATWARCYSATLLCVWIAAHSSWNAGAGRCGMSREGTAKLNKVIETEFTKAIAKLCLAFLPPRRQLPPLARNYLM